MREKELVLTSKSLLHWLWNSQVMPMSLQRGPALNSLSTATISLPASVFCRGARRISCQREVCVPASLVRCLRNLVGLPKIPQTLK